MLTSVRRTRQEIETQLRKLVSRVIPGARIYFPRKRTPPCGYSWNCRHLRPTGQTLESQMHEVAHLLVAKAERHTMPEFGLGPDPYRRSHAKRTISESEADEEELDACAMQLLLVRLFGLNEDAVIAEVQAKPVTKAHVRLLQKRHPRALPEDLWREALSVSPM